MMGQLIKLQIFQYWQVSLSFYVVPKWDKGAEIDQT